MAFKTSTEKNQGIISKTYFNLGRGVDHGGAQRPFLALSSGVTPSGTQGITSCARDSNQCHVQGKHFTSYTVSPALGKHV